MWKALKEKMDKVYTRVDGFEMRPSFCCIDSGGHNTNDIYRNTFREPRILAIKGYVSDKKNAVDPLIGKYQKIKFNGGVKAHCPLLLLGVNAGKDFLENLIILTMTGDHCLHYPKGHGFDVEYYEGLLSEKKIAGRWKPKAHAHNEPLDTFVYSLAAYQFWRDKFLLTGKDEEYEMARKKKAELEQEPKQEIKEVKTEVKQVVKVEPKVEPKPEVRPEPPKKKIPQW